MTSKVYFTREITPEAVLKLYEMLNTKLEGKVAVKLHSAIALGPFERAVRREGLIVELRGSYSCLDLGVVAGSLAVG